MDLERMWYDRFRSFVAESQVHDDYSTSSRKKHCLSVVGFCTLTYCVLWESLHRPLTFHSLSSTVPAKLVSKAGLRLHYQTTYNLAFNWELGSSVDLRCVPISLWILVSGLTVNQTGLDHLFSSFEIPPNPSFFKELEVYITSDDNIKISFGPFNPELHRGKAGEDKSLQIFDDLCSEVFKQANRLLYQDVPVERDPSGSSLFKGTEDNTSTGSTSAPEGGPANNPPAQGFSTSRKPRIELAWKTPPQTRATVASIAQHYKQHLELLRIRGTMTLQQLPALSIKEISPIHHRCSGRFILLHMRSGRRRSLPHKKVLKVLYMEPSSLWAVKIELKTCRGSSHRRFLLSLFNRSARPASLLLPRTSTYNNEDTETETETEKERERERESFAAALNFGGFGSFGALGGFGRGTTSRGGGGGRLMAVRQQHQQLSQPRWSTGNASAGGEFEGDWEPAPGMPGGLPVEEPPPSPEPPAPEVSQAIPEWGEVTQGLRERRREEAPPPLDLPPPPGFAPSNVEPRRQVHSWATWQPTPDFQPSPPSHEPTLLIPGPSSPADPGLQPSPPSHEPTFLVSDQISPVFSLYMRDFEGEGEGFIGEQEPSRVEGGGRRDMMVAREEE
ncbi:hypothetical protein K435DRAFT_796435 [Dendrothele bispora CBS 962.96]|uniref:Uncharacterized protein n=1 Tax=Dendrothele bispora (strain CBS 962.96) TaxID=1314807 RepID=A0A4S8M6S9_DENBC|nr:hypothetical protein K435DRAFT_796435 [Dendrothele bispora CBS 962.96]